MFSSFKIVIRYIVTLLKHLTKPKVTFQSLILDLFM